MSRDGRIRWPSLLADGRDEQTMALDARVTAGRIVQDIRLISGPPGPWGRLTELLATCMDGTIPFDDR